MLKAFYYRKKVNKYLKSIDLKKKFKNFLRENKKKQLIFLITFCIPHKSSIKNFLKLSINKHPKGTH